MFLLECRKTFVENGPKATLSALEEMKAAAQVRKMVRSDDNLGNCCKNKDVLRKRKRKRERTCEWRNRVEKETKRFVGLIKI